MGMRPQGLRGLDLRAEDVGLVLRPQAATEGLRYCPLAALWMEGAGDGAVMGKRGPGLS